MTFENGANSGHWLVKWSERWESNPRPLSPQNRYNSRNPMKYGVFNSEQVGNVPQVFARIRGVVGAGKS